jgi:dTDP-4-amino-4,6-dideoxygalactose transaminase
MKVPLLDLKAQYQTIKPEILKAAEEVFESQYFILGPRVEALEKEIARYSDCPFAVGVSSGTDALLIALMAAGVGAGDLVLTTPYSFFATAGAVARMGARTLFADIDPDTCNISPESAAEVIKSMGRADRKRLKAMIPVHLYGQCADMDPLMALADRYGLIMIEDAAQAIGSVYRGRRAGSIGSFGCFSFFPSKNLGAFGDGGMVTCRSEDLCEKLRILRAHGSQPKYYHKRVGGNFRLDALQAAIVSVKLKYLDGWTEARRKNAQLYRSLFAEAGLAGRIVLPVEKEERHIFNQFVIRVPEKRDKLHAALREAGIGTEVYYPVPLHLQECFADLGYRKGDFPAAEDAAERTLALPIYPELAEEQQRYVVEKIREFYRT